MSDFGKTIEQMNTELIFWSVTDMKLVKQYPKHNGEVFPSWFFFGQFALWSPFSILPHLEINNLKWKHFKQVVTWKHSTFGQHSSSGREKFSLLESTMNHVSGNFLIQKNQAFSSLAPHSFKVILTGQNNHEIFRIHEDTITYILRIEQFDRRGFLFRGTLYNGQCGRDEKGTIGSFCLMNQSIQPVLITIGG